jgi:hypothetical protein
MEKNWMRELMFVTMSIVFVAITSGQQRTFDDWKDLIATGESASNTQKVHGNANGTVDCGKYQINSIHFNWRDTTAIPVEMNRIFKRFKVGRKLWVRVVHAITNDELNEELARIVFKHQGIRAWTSMRGN